MRRAAQRIDAEYRKVDALVGRCDLDDAHIFRAADRLVLTDLYRAILDDVAGCAGRFRASGCATHGASVYRPENSNAEILALKARAHAAG